MQFVVICHLIFQYSISFVFVGRVRGNYELVQEVADLIAFLWPPLLFSRTCPYRVSRISTIPKVLVLSLGKPYAILSTFRYLELTDEIFVKLSLFEINQFFSYQNHVVTFELFILCTLVQ